MLSYQHAYHAGNLADVHKHSLLAVMLSRMAEKDKPFTYLETHAGRGLYNLDAPEAVKTGEATQGITRVLDRNWFPPDHPYARVIGAVRDHYGPAAYPGSPLIAAFFLRSTDRATVAELHPQEFDALNALMADRPVYCRKMNGLEMALSLTPPDPRRGLMLIDPSWEVKADYERMAGLVRAVHRKWNVGVIALWYPILAEARHTEMIREIRSAALPRTLCHEVRFASARAHHGMVGSGMFIANAPYSLDVEAARLSRLFSENGL